MTRREAAEDVISYVEKYVEGGQTFVQSREVDIVVAGSVYDTETIAFEAVYGCRGVAMAHPQSDTHHPLGGGGGEQVGQMSIYIFHRVSQQRGGIVGRRTLHFYDTIVAPGLRHVTQSVQQRVGVYDTGTTVSLSDLQLPSRASFQCVKHLKNVGSFGHIGE